MTQKNTGERTAAYVFLIAALILFYRFPDRLLSGFLWAEDGLRFLPDAYQFGFRALVSPYQGYLHALPRLIAYLAARTTPVPCLPFVLPVVCLVITSIGAMVTYLGALRLPWRSYPAAWAALVALSPLLVPHSGEVFLNITNLQWLAAPVLLALLYLAPAIQGKGALAAATAALILAMSGPFSVLMLPFVATVVAFRFRGPVSRATGLIFAGYIFGTVVQGMVILTCAGDPTPPGALVGVLDASTRDLLGPAFFPRALLSRSEMAAMGATAILALALGSAFWKMPVRFELFAMLAFGFIVWAAGMAKIGSGARILWDGGAARYTFLPYVFLAWALLIGAGTATSIFARRSSVALCIAMLLISSTMFVPLPPVKTSVDEASEAGYVIHVPPGWTGTLKPGKLRLRR